MAATPNLDDLALNSARLIDKADALIARNRSDGMNDDHEELPVLTEAIIVPTVETSAPPMDPIDLDLLSESVEENSTPPQSERRTGQDRRSTVEAIAESARAETPAGLDSQHVTEKLIELDAYLAQTLNTWINNELPGIIQSEVGNLSERIRTQTIAHMRATLLADISDKLIGVIEETLNKNNN